MTKKKRKRKFNTKNLIIISIFCVIMVVLVLWAIIFAVKNSSMKIENIGTRREMFWDNYIIDTEKTTATLTQHNVQKKDVVFEIDKPWEGSVADGFNIIKADDVYHMYYLTYSSKNDVKVCYAQSIDGLTWDKPQAGIVEYEGSTNNNILISDSVNIANGFYAFIDNKLSVKKDEYYKAIAINADNDLITYTSNDGIKWIQSNNIGKKNVTNLNKPITLNTAFYSEEHNLYYCYFVKTNNDNQEIYLTTSKNFKTWSSPKRISYQKNANQFNMQTANISHYYRAPHLFMGLPLRSTKIDNAGINIAALSNNTGRQEAQIDGDNFSELITDTIFMSSRDGSKWNINEEAWLSSGPEHDSNWIFGDSFTSSGMIETSSLHSNAGEDNELSFYVAENQLAESGTKLRRYTSRIDGFTSYQSTYNTQKVVTKPIKFSGNRMTLNFRTSPNGYVFVRILDANGEPFKSIQYEDEQQNSYEVPAYTSYELIGDRVDREVAFNGNLEELNNKTVILEFYMSDANIYSFKFDDESYQNTADWKPIEIPVREYNDIVNETSEETLNIGSERQLFWDNYIVDETESNANLVAISPTRKEEIFKTDLPWEGNNCDYYVIVNDTDENGQDYQRMYYLGWDSSDPADIRVCYAYSYDGSEWIKPNLGANTYTDKTTGKIYTDTNIMLYTEEKIFDNFFVVKDTRADVPANKRYKAIAQGGYDQLGFDSYGLWAWASPDGIHWKKTHNVLTENEEWFGAFDSVNTFVWNEKTQQFFTYFRVRDDQSLNGVDFIDFRKLYGAVSDEFVPVNPDTIFSLNYGDNSPIFEMYTNNINKYYRAPQVFLGFPTRFTRRIEWAKTYEYLASPAARYEGYSSGQVTKSLSMTDTLFMTSRDGYNWNRQNESWLTPGPEHEANWIYGNCYPAYGLIETKTENENQDNELSTYVFEGKFYKEPSVLYRYTMRVDGFKAYKSTFNPQKVTTKPFIFTGNSLLLNFKTSSAGSVNIKILDLKGNPIDGYDSGKIIGDRVDRNIIFDKNLDNISGQPIILEFTLSDAEIYSFKFN